eukprot:8666034-Ditylum_brightwellii.AAC.1
MGSKLQNTVGKVQNWTCNSVVGLSMANGFAFNAVLLICEQDMAVCEGRDVFYKEVHSIDASTAKVEEGITK